MAFTLAPSRGAPMTEAEKLRRRAMMVAAQQGGNGAGAPPPEPWQPPYAPGQGPDIIDPDSLARSMFRKTHQDIDPQLRGTPPPMQRQPMTPNGPIKLPLDNERNDDPMAQYYRELMKPTSTVDRFRSALQVPTGPLTSPKGRKNRLFLRGAISGFKNSGAPPEDRKNLLEAMKLRASQSAKEGAGGASGSAGRSPSQIGTDEALTRQRDARTAQIRAKIESDRRAGLPTDPKLKAEIEALEALKYQRRESGLASSRRLTGPQAVSYSQRRTALAQKRDSELSRLRAVVQQVNPPGEDGKTSPPAEAQWNRLRARTETEYMRQLEALNQEFGIADEGGGGRTQGMYGATNSVGGYDISRYATNPAHEENVGKHYDSISTAIDTYIKRVAPGSPVTGEMVSRAAERYGVDPKVIVSIMQEDSSLGTRGKGVRTNNPGNVGNDDAGNERSFGNVEEGVMAVAEWLSRHKEKAGFSDVRHGGSTSATPQAPRPAAQVARPATKPAQKRQLTEDEMIRMMDPK